MNKLIISFALSFAAFAANAAPSTVEAQVAACEANAGAHNGPEKAACIQVAREGAVQFAARPFNAVAACDVAGAFNSDEKAACKLVAVERAVANCDIAGAFNTDEKAACKLVARELN